MNRNEIGVEWICRIVSGEERGGGGDIWNASSLVMRFFSAQRKEVPVQRDWPRLKSFISSAHLWVRGLL